MKKFEVGAMYWDTSAVDHNDVMVIKITRRTEKSVWFVRVYNGKEDGEPSRTKIFTDATREYVMPYRYSMAPVWKADRKVEPEAAEETAEAEQGAAEAAAEPATETETSDAAQEAAPEAEVKDDVCERVESLRIMGRFLNKFIADGNRTAAHGVKDDIDRALAVDKEYGVVLSAEYDADGRFVDVRERTETADDGAEAGQPAPQAGAAPEGAESVEAESETTADSAESAVSYYEIPHIANDRYIPVAAFRVDLAKDETRLFSRALAEYVYAVEIPDTRDGDYEIMRRFDCVRMLTRLTQDLFDAALDSVGGTVEFRFFPLIFQETESYVRWVMFHALKSVERLTKEAERHLKSATEAGFNDTAGFYRDRLTALQGLDFRIRLAFDAGFRAAEAAA